MSAPEWRGILDGLGEAVLAANGEQMIVYANAAAEALLGWPSGGLIGQRLAAVIPLSMRRRHDAGFRRHRAGGAPRLIGRRARVPALRHDGSEIRAELALSAVGSGSESLYVAALRPVGQRVEPGRAPAGPTPLDALVKSAAVLGSLTDPDEVPRRVAELLQLHFGAATSRLWLYDAQSDMLRQPMRVRSRSAPPDPLPADLALSSPFVAADVARIRQVWVSNRVWESGQFPSEWLRREGLQSAAFLPLLHVGELGGVLGVFSREAIDEELRQSLELFASRAAEALGRGRAARLTDERDQALEAAAVLSGLLQDAAAGMPPPELFPRVLERGMALLEMDGGLVIRLGEGATGTEVVACAGFGAPLTGYVVPPGKSLARLAAEVGAVQISADYLSEPLALPPLRQRGVRGAVVAPVRMRGAVWGALSLTTKRPGLALSPGQLTLVEGLAGVVGCAVVRR